MWGNQHKIIWKNVSTIWLSLHVTINCALWMWTGLILNFFSQKSKNDTQPSKTNSLIQEPWDLKGNWFHSQCCLHLMSLMSLLFLPHWAQMQTLCSSWETSLWKPEARILTSAVQMPSFPKGKSPCHVKQQHRQPGSWVERHWNYRARGSLGNFSIEPISVQISAVSPFELCNLGHINLSLSASVCKTVWW